MDLSAAILSRLISRGILSALRRRRGIRALPVGRSAAKMRFSPGAHLPYKKTASIPEAYLTGADWRRCPWLQHRPPSPKGYLNRPQGVGAEQRARTTSAEPATRAMAQAVER